jgi:hypothetical protein
MLSFVILDPYRKLVGPRTVEPVEVKADFRGGFLGKNTYRRKTRETY